jgi:hypothetical protein
MHALFDCSIFRNIAFTIFLISYLAGSIGCFYPIVFIPALADFNGISKTQQSLLISICSAVDIFGRAGSGLFPVLNIEQSNSACMYVFKLFFFATVDAEFTLFISFSLCSACTDRIISTVETSNKNSLLI